MHIDIAASELVDIDCDSYFKMQEDWKSEIKNCLGRMKKGNIQDYFSAEDEAELVRKRTEELQHAQDIREHYERKLEKANNLYVEVTSCLLQLEQRERDLIQREQSTYCSKCHNKRRVVKPLLEAAQERANRKYEENNSTHAVDDASSPELPSSEEQPPSSQNHMSRTRFRRSRSRQSGGSATSGNSASRRKAAGPRAVVSRKRDECRGQAFTSTTRFLRTTHHIKASSRTATAVRATFL